jgi:hypothetical protein
MRISIEGCRAAPHCQRKSQAMTDTGRSDSKCRGSNPAAPASQSGLRAYRMNAVQNGGVPRHFMGT